MPTAEVQNMIPKIQRFFATQPVNRTYLFGHDLLQRDVDPVEVTPRACALSLI